MLSEARGSQQMSGKLVRTIRTTTVRPQQQPEENMLSDLDRSRLAAYRDENRLAIQLRRTGLTAEELRNLEILRWQVQSGRITRG